MGVFRHKDNKGSDMYNAHVQRTGTKDTMDPTSSLHDSYQEDYDTIKDYYTPLDLAPDAAAAYSLRKLRLDYDGPAIRVRRTTDNSEQDIGFNGSGQIDREALADFAQEVVIYTSDFTSGNEDLSEGNGIGTDGETIAGVSDAYKFTLTGGFNLHDVRVSGAKLSTKYRYQFDYYIPSTNTLLNRIHLTHTVEGPYFTELDTWANASVEVEHNVTSFLIRGTNGTTAVYSADGDVFYLKNIVITELPSLAVTTWYDQSGNGNDATQATAANQPKIVNAGALVTENGKPAIDFDGVDDSLNQMLADDFYGTKDIYLFAVTKNASNSETGGITQKRDAVTDGNFGFGAFSGKYQIQARDIGTGDAVLNTVNTYNTQQLISANRDASGLNFYLPEVLSISSSVADLTSTGASDIGAGSSYGALDGTIQELVIYTSDQSSNRTDIETNINNYYKIF